MKKNAYLHEFYVLRKTIPIKFNFFDYNDIKSKGKNLYCIIVQGSCSPLQLLLSAGMDVCVCGSSGDTPLLLALGLGTKKIVIGGYTLNFKNSSYTTRCSTEETLDVVKSLLAVGALVNACSKRGVVPLHIAAARGHLALIDLLKNSGAIANAEDEGR
jgi:ankyrin repeat protein